MVIIDSSDTKAETASHAKQPRFPAKGTGAVFFRHFMERARNAAIWALVQAPAGSNFPLPMPVVMPFSTAHTTAS